MARMTAPAQPLAGRVVWVTGAGRGLGRAIATGLVANGATVVATARNADSLDALAAEHTSGRVVTAPGSVADPADIARIVTAFPKTAEGHPQVHGLVNCAGISPVFVRSEQLDSHTFAEILEVNTLGTFICAQAAARLMLEQPGGGSIVNISSVHARAGSARMAAYAASKGAVEALTATLAVEWAKRGIRVNTVAPGYYPTDLSHGLLESHWREGILGKIPMGRTGDPSELVGVTSFLLSDAASYVTGTTVAVDGGWLAQ